MPLIKTSRRGPVGSLGFKLLLFSVLAFVGMVSAVMYFFLKSETTSTPLPTTITVYRGSDTLPPDTPAPASLFAPMPLPDDAAALSEVPTLPPPGDPLKTLETAAGMMPNTSPSGFVAVSPDTRNAAELGLFVAEPVFSQSTARDVSNFGTAAGDWLHLLAAGQPTFGRTPEWPTRQRIGQELNCDLDLTPGQIKPLASMAGVTDVACGTISGTSKAAVLTYQLYAVPSLTPVGSKITAVGTLVQIEAALPTVARQLDSDLGITNPIIPSSTSLTAGEMTTLGSMTYTADETISNMTILATLSKSSPLAGIYLLSTAATDDSLLLNHTVHTLLLQAPQNALVVNDIAFYSTRCLQPYAAKTSALCSHYPQSALLSHVAVWDQRAWGNRIDELADALRVSDDSPNDPVSWLALEETLGNIAEDVRGGRYSSDVPQSASSLLQTMYAQMRQYDSNAVVLDPKYGHGWFQLTQSAAFAGDEDTANLAFKNASKYDPNMAEVDGWGLQLFQPKWYSDPSALYSVASRAAGRSYGRGDTAVDMAGTLSDVASSTGDARFSALGEQLISKKTAEDRTAEAADPSNPWVHWDLAVVLASDTNNLREATKEYRIAEHLLPNAAELHYAFSLTLHTRGKLNAEISELRQAVSLDPFDSDAHTALGDRLKQTGKYVEAAKELKLAIRLNPTDADAYYSLGLNDEQQNDYKSALPNFQASVKLFPVYGWGYFQICRCDDELGRIQDSLDAGQKALQADQQSGNTDTTLEDNVHDMMADDYEHFKDWSDSLSESQQAQKLVPGDPWAEENTAEAEWGAGNTGAAQADWEQVAAGSDPYLAAEAKKYLKEHFGASGF